MHMSVMDQKKSPEVCHYAYILFTHKKPGVRNVQKNTLSHYHRRTWKDALESTRHLQRRHLRQRAKNLPALTRAPQRRIEHKVSREHLHARSVYEHARADGAQHALCDFRAYAAASVSGIEDDEAESIPAGVVSAKRSARSERSQLRLDCCGSGCAGRAAMRMPSERPSKSWWNDMAVARDSKSEPEASASVNPMTSECSMMPSCRTCVWKGEMK